jgi:hypothetical protein
VSIGIEAPMVVEAVLRMSYGPLVTPLLRNLARVAARRDVAA